MAAFPRVDIGTTAQRSNGGPLCRNFKSATPAPGRHGCPGRARALRQFARHVSRIVAQRGQQIRYKATRLTANSLWKQSFGGNYAVRRQPLFLASRDFILYPEQSATAGIRFM
jgi:hypothetical protein